MRTIRLCVLCRSKHHVLKGAHPSPMVRVEVADAAIRVAVYDRHAFICAALTIGVLCVCASV